MAVFSGYLMYILATELKELCPYCITSALFGLKICLSPISQKVLTQQLRELELVVFGASEPVNPPDFGLKTRYLGRLNDDISLALVYSAADVFVAPSIQDNLPNTVMESLACGTPCVAFKIGGSSRFCVRMV